MLLTVAWALANGFLNTEAYVNNKLIIWQHHNNNNYLATAYFNYVLQMLVRLRLPVILLDIRGSTSYGYCCENFCFLYSI